jgi:hypothetical protein
MAILSARSRRRVRRVFFHLNAPPGILQPHAVWCGVVYASVRGKRHRGSPIAVGKAPIPQVVNEASRLKEASAVRL